MGPIAQLPIRSFERTIRDRASYASPHLRRRSTPTATDGHPRADPARDAARDRGRRDRRRVNRRVAAEAGVALGSLTYHFPSRRTCCATACCSTRRRRSRGWTRWRPSCARATAHPTPSARGGRASSRSPASGSGRPEEIAELELHLHASRDPELHAASERCFGAYEDFAAAALEALGVPEPERHARTVVALMCGLGVRRLGTGEHSAEGTADALLTVLRGARAD